MHKFIYVILAAMMGLDALLQYLIASRTADHSLVRPFLYGQAILPILALLTVFAIRGARFWQAISSRIRGNYAIYISFFFLWAASSTILGLAFADRLFNVALDLLRSISPFLMLLSLVASLDKNATKERSMSDLCALLFFSLYGLILAKVTLLGSGQFYGGGAHQFLYPIITLILLVFLFVNKSISSKLRLPILGRPSKSIIILLIFLILMLTVLSMKREQWLIASLAVCLTVFINARNPRTFIFTLTFFAVGLVAYFTLVDQSVAEQLLWRFQYTFSGTNQLGVDASTFERTAEIMGVTYTLGEHIGWIEYITGHGNGAEYRLHPSFPSVKDQTGSDFGLFRHVHSMYGILLFRNGLVGVFLYTLPLFVQILKDIRTMIFQKQRPEPFSLALSITAICFLVAGIPANSAYGSMYYGVFLALSLVQANSWRSG